MRISALLLLTLLVFQSCFQNNDSQPQDVQHINDCDEVTIKYYTHNDTLPYNTKDSTEIEILTKLISGKQDPIGDTCKPAGQLIYKSKGQNIFKAEFSTTDTNEEYDCNFVLYHSENKTYKHKLTYRAGRLLDETIWAIKSSTLKIDIDSIRFYKDTIKKADENNS